MNFILDILSQVIKIIKKILPYIALALVLYFTFGVGGAFFSVAALSTTITLTGYGWAALAIGASFLLAPTETTAMVTRVATAIADTAAKVIAIAADALIKVAGAVAGSFFSSPIGFAVMGLGAYFLLSGHSKKDEDHQRGTA